MIHYVEGNLLESEANAIVNTVNTVGVMGKGIALQFKNQFPNNAKLYNKACKDGSIAIGKLLVTKDESLIGGKKIIINFPTKTDWRKPSEYQYIEEGLKDLLAVIEEYQIKSLAIPPLGAGNGGLDWNKVKAIMEKYLAEINVDIFIYHPNFIVKEVLKKERVALTPARAMLLSVLFDLVKNGEFVSEFAAEKIAYFLQRFGAKDTFRLEFQPNFYGPYSGKVKHVLHYLNGSYISGYSSKDKKPFEELGLMMDSEVDVDAFLAKPENKENLEVVQKTKDFLSGSYSYFALELLTTIDYIIVEKKSNSIEDITTYLSDWSERKRTLFSKPDFILMAVNKIQFEFSCLN